MFSDEGISSSSSPLPHRPSPPMSTFHKSEVGAAQKLNLQFVANLRILPSKFYIWSILNQNFIFSDSLQISIQLLIKTHWHGRSKKLLNKFLADKFLDWDTDRPTDQSCLLCNYMWVLCPCLHQQVHFKPSSSPNQGVVSSSSSSFSSSREAF